MKVTDYPSVVDLKENNVFLLDGPDGTKQISAKHLANELVKMDGQVESLSDRMKQMEEKTEEKNGEYDKAIEDLKKSVAEGKSAVASAITQKGVSTSADASFSDMANNIGKIITELTSNSILYINSFTGGSGNFSYTFSRNTKAIVIASGGRTRSFNKSYTGGDMTQIGGNSGGGNGNHATYGYLLNGIAGQTVNVNFSLYETSSSGTDYPGHAMMAVIAAS